MRFTIYLDCKLRRRAVEVDHVITYAVLASKLQTVNLSSAEAPPKQPLGLGCIIAQTLAKLFLHLAIV